MSTKTSNNPEDLLEAEAAASLVEPLLPPEQPDRLMTSPTNENTATDAHATETVNVSTSSGVPVERNEGQDQENVTEQLLSLDETTWDHGQVQENSFRDWPWAILFCLQVFLVLALAITALTSLSKGDYTLPDEKFHWNVDLVYLVVTFLAIMGLSGAVILLLLGPLSDMMIQLSLVLSPISCGLSCIGSLFVGQFGMAFILAAFCVFGVVYAVGVWHRIPFGTANLAVALAALKANKGMIGMAYATSFATMLWTLIWVFALAQVSVVKYEWTMVCSDVDDDDQDVHCHLTTKGKWILLGLLFSLYWTYQVFKNVFRTTISGVVGTFWFAPADANGGCCNPALRDSWVRSTVYSFGSICLGSLLVALIQLLQFLVRCGRTSQEQRAQREGRQNQGASIAWCLLQFVVDQLERLMEYINSWAFVYVGLYGFDYVSAGHKVCQLFKARGWSLILNDHLIARSLAMMQLLIGLLAGIVSMLIGFVMYGFFLNPLGTFFIGMFLGIVLSNIQFQVVTSAVATVIVCFAEQPRALVDNHPEELSSRMIRAWRAAYPSECGF